MATKKPANKTSQNKDASPKKRGRPAKPISSGANSAEKVTKPKKKMGRPKGTPDVWTVERKAEVCAQLEEYVKKTAYPSVADFCYRHLVRRSRLYEFEEFAFWREMLILKKTAELERMGRTLNRDHGSRGNFIALALGQVGFRDTPEAVSDEEALKARAANFDTLFGGSGAPI